MAVKKKVVEEKPVEGTIKFKANILDENNEIPASHISELMAKAEIKTQTFFGNCMVVAAKFPNGQVIVDYTQTITPEQYNREEGKQICLDLIKKKLVEFEVYKALDELAYK